MKITYISHATLKIEIGNLKIVTDPWVRGTAYCDQWHLFPKAIEPNLITDADVVLYSHGHEDHLHPYSLQLINKNAHFFILTHGTMALLRFLFKWGLEISMK